MFTSRRLLVRRLCAVALTGLTLSAAPRSTPKSNRGSPAIRWWGPAWKTSRPTPLLVFGLNFDKFKGGLVVSLAGTGSAGTDVFESTAGAVGPKSLSGDKGNKGTKTSRAFKASRA